MPEPLLMKKQVEDAIAGVKAAGWSGSDIFMAAHSLGSVMAQDYVYNNTQTSIFKGQILMGGSLARKYRHNNNATGETVWKYPVPTLTLAAEKDGLYRITRNAEAYYHMVKNIDGAERGRYPVVLLKGMSHVSFMDISMAPGLVKSDDLKPEVDQTTGY